MCCSVSLACETAETSLPRWSLARELRIGDESSPEYALTAVRSIRIDSAGAMYVVHPQDTHIRVFDANGHFLRYVGRRGEGPGEFDRLAQAGLRADTLWVADGSAIAKFTLDGQLLHDIPIRYATGRPGFGFGGIDYVLRDGTYSVVPTWAPNLDRSQWPSGIPMLAIQPDGTGARLIGEFDLEFLRIFTLPNGRPGFAFLPFRPPFLYALAPDGSSIIFVRQRAAESQATSSFHVVRVGFAGDTIFAHDIRYAPVAVPQDVKDSVYNAAAGIGENPLPRESLDARFEAAPIPAFYPPVRAVVLASDGSTWLHTQGVPNGEWLILDPDGLPFARADGPAALQIMAVAGDQLWGVELDDYDVPSVVRYRITR
jgi:hypothetical protein